MLTTNDLRRHWRAAIQRARIEGPQVIYLHKRPLLRVRALGPEESHPKPSVEVSATDFLLQPTPYIWRAAAGERILITRRGKPVALLEPLDAGNEQAKDREEG